MYTAYDEKWAKQKGVVFPSAPAPILLIRVEK